jgi:3'-5' exonuclease
MISSSRDECIRNSGFFTLRTNVPSIFVVLLLVCVADPCAPAVGFAPASIVLSSGPMARQILRALQSASRHGSVRRRPRLTAFHHFHASHSLSSLAVSRAVVADTVEQLPVEISTLTQRETLIETSFARDPAATNTEQRLQQLGIRSRPVAGGNWRVNDPLGWTKSFGKRSAEYEARLRDLALLRPSDEGYFDVSQLQVPGVTIVRTPEQAATVLKRLDAAPRNGAIFHACDTEVMDIDARNVGPVGNGYVTCVSIYSGPDFDYGLGDGPGSVLWIDNLDDSYGLLNIFKPWFQDESHWKVWHNYGFDRHVMWNEGIDVRGFGGDTMHMARLLDTDRIHRGSGYSLEELTEDVVRRRKKPMKEIFGIPRQRKDGSAGLILDIPPVEVLQRDPTHRAKWIEYSCYDAQGTWLLREELQKRLQSKSWFFDEEAETEWNLYDYYVEHLRPFGEVLTDMERRGIRVDARNYLASVEVQARKDREEHSYKFRQWAASKIGPGTLLAQEILPTVNASNSRIYF